MKSQSAHLNPLGFQQFSLESSLLSSLEQLQITQPTEIQSEVIPKAVLGQDLIAIAETGSGKTLAFALPLLTLLHQNQEARALILVPSREMAQQTLKIIKELCLSIEISCSLIIGGVPSSKQISSLKKIPRLIIATPGRLNDHLLKNKMLLQNMKMIVIDEADRLLDMGFSLQLKNIHSTLRTIHQTLMFSATFNSAVEKIAQLFLKQNFLMIRTDQAENPVTTLKQRVLFIESSKKNDRLLDELNATEKSVIVFCGNQASCEQTGHYLKEYGYKTDFIHGGLSQGHRNRVIRQFREGQIRVLVATDLLARGIDIPHVDHVFNFDLPFQAEDFLHRIGRTARAGRVGESLTFVTKRDSKMYEKIKPYLADAIEEKLDITIDLNTLNNTRQKVSEVQNKKPRKDKYKDLAQKSLGLGKPSVWKKNHQPPRKKM